MTRFEPLRVRRLRARSVVAPLAAPVVTASGTLSESHLVLIDLDTHEGVTGHAYLCAYTDFARNPLAQLAGNLGKLIADDPLVPGAIGAKLAARFTLLGGATSLSGIAVSGINMAAWDALARAANMPMARLLGGEPKPLPAYKSLGMVPAARGREEGALARTEGFKAAKFKLGWPTLEEDLEAVRSFRDGAGDEMTLMIDYNQSLDAAEALRRGIALDGENIGWIEEPVRCDDFEGAAQLTAALATPVQIGENFSSPANMRRALDARACRFVMPDVQQIGGVSGWVEAAALASAFGIPMSSHLFVEMSAHLLAVTPTAHWLEHLDIASTVLRGGPKVEGGTVTASEQPGFGFEWDEDAVDRYAAN